VIATGSEQNYIIFRVSSMSFVLYAHMSGLNLFQNQLPEQLKMSESELRRRKLDEAGDTGKSESETERFAR
jgi:hypothetical protein